MFHDHRQLTAPDGTKSRHIIFDTIEVQGGGKIEIQSDSIGFTMHCTLLWLRSGAALTADRLTVKAQNVIIEESAKIDLNFRVSTDSNVSFILLIRLVLSVLCYS